MYGCLEFGLCFLTRWQLCHKTSDSTAVRCLADVERQQLRIVKDCTARLQYDAYAVGAQRLVS